MGNCTLKGVVEKSPNSIRVLTDSGIITQFKGPKLAKDVLNEYPAGYGIFKQGHGSSPLAGHEPLNSGQFYYLLPLKEVKVLCDSAEEVITDDPPKMSTAELVENVAALEVLQPPAKGNGVWRVKLVINTKQLEEILAEQVNTEALIEKMRMAASLSSTSSSLMSMTPRKRSRNSWVVNWKPTALSNVFKVPIDNGK